jgi:hypothetical protein
VQVLKACADNAWGLYLFNVFPYKYFCCSENAVGVSSSYDKYLCMEKSLPIPSSITLGLVRGYLRIVVKTLTTF